MRVTCRSLIPWLLGLWMPVGALSAEGNFAQSPSGRDFIQQMVASEGFDRQSLESWLGRAQHRQSVIERISAPAEKVLEWGDYRRIFISAERIERGKAFMVGHDELLDRAKARYGVSPFMITAIIGIETFYGRHKGNDRVLDALATLAFDYPPRADFFRDELRHYLILAREQGFRPEDPKGSYAGAMGYGQFIPSSYRHYAVDFNDDGKVDLCNSIGDAIGSVANYLSEHGWRRNGPVARPLERNHRVTPIRPADLLVLRDGNENGYWLVYHNFDVIRQYNHSDLYVMAAWQLAQSLEADQ